MGQERRRTGTSPAVPFTILGIVLAGFLVVDAGLYGGSALSGDGQTLPLNPFSAPFLLVGHRASWSVASTIVAAVTAFLLLAIVTTIAVMVIRRRGRRGRVDHKASLMGRGGEIADMTQKTVAQAAARFGVTDVVGVFLAVAVERGQKLYADFESVILQIWGPRQGKSSTQVIPMVLDAPGAVLTTSNKPDVIDATRDLRARKGTVWAFDPQHISGDKPTWWWNPLSYVTSDEKAAALGKIFADAGREAGVKPDAYFDPAARNLIADLFLAAAIDSRPITDVYSWVAQGSPTAPLTILKNHNGGMYRINVESLEVAINLPSDQKAGVWGSASEMLQSLKYLSAAPWVNKTTAGDLRPHFDVDAFVRSSDTLYVLSKEGGGSAAALTTALTVAVADAAERYAMTCHGRRLPVPLLLPLDEIANVCPWKDLPDKYSHYGSKGIIPVAFLQSWSQGVELWGAAGMEKIWSAATVKVVGSGLAEEPFLRKVSGLIGEYTYDTVSESHGKNGRTRSINPGGGKEHIFTVSDLQEMPRGRVVVFRAGARPALARTIQWSEGPHAAEITASLGVHEPAAATSPATSEPTSAATSIDAAAPIRKNAWIEADE